MELAILVILVCGIIALMARFIGLFFNNLYLEIHLSAFQICREFKNNQCQNDFLICIYLVLTISESDSFRTNQ